MYWALTLWKTDGLITDNCCILGCDSMWSSRSIEFHIFTHAQSNSWPIKLSFLWYGVHILCQHKLTLGHWVLKMLKSLTTKFPTFYEFQFHHHVYWSLSGARQISSKHSHTDQFNIILQFIPMSWKWLHFFSFPNKLKWMFLKSSMCLTCPIKLICLYLITLIHISYTLWSST